MGIQQRPGSYFLLQLGILIVRPCLLSPGRTALHHSFPHLPIFSVALKGQEQNHTEKDQPFSSILKGSTLRELLSAMEPLAHCPLRAGQASLTQGRISRPPSGTRGGCQQAWSRGAAVKSWREHLVNKRFPSPSQQ